jgi:multiple sugar transport system substrate-binding protein
MARKITGTSSGRISRRRLLAAAGVGVAGAAALKLTAPWEVGVAPAQIKGTTLRILTWSHFVPAYDTAFDKYAVDWGKANGVDVRVDHIPIDQLPARIASELAAGAGHDIFQMNGILQTTLYYNHMVDVSDICDKLGKAGGGWLPMATNVATVNGNWYAVPEFYIPQPIMWRQDLWTEFNLPSPVSWDNLRTAARIGKSHGHPSGFAISHCNDSNHNWRAVFYAFGVEETDPTGKELRWDSKALRDAMKFSRALWVEGMTTEVFSWDNVSDNRYLDSGVAVYIHDALSSLFSVEDSNPKLFASINAGVPGAEPKGPVRSAAVVDPTILGIWSFSQSQAGAKAFLEQYGTDVKFSLEASKGYNMPYQKAWYKKPMPGLATHLPKLGLIQDWHKVALVFGYPGPATAPAAEVLSTFVVPDMVARYCHNNDLEGSIKWGLDQIKGIYAKYK